MSIKVRDIAHNMHLSEPGVIEYLSDLGISVDDMDSTLSNKDVRKLNAAIQLMRKLNQQRTRSGDTSNKFALAKTITNISEEDVSISYVPKENDIVFDARKKIIEDSSGFFSKIKRFLWGSEEKSNSQNNTKRNQIKLVKKLGVGGEATVYSTDTPYVAKIYNKDKLNKRKEAKIELMTSKNIKYQGICFPVSSLYDDKNNFIGFLMPIAEGKEIQKSVFLPLLPKTFPNWKKRDLIILCLTILDKVKYLHRHNIIMGDINSLNILVKSPTDVYFVDTDSYQVEEFPCPVGTVPFTAQEILQENKIYKQRYKKDRTYSQFLRTFSSDYFSIAVLLFMILMVGKNPYSLQGGESIEDNMLNMDFAYPLDDLKNEKAPAGAWGYIWSHLPYLIKQDFYNSFHRDGNCNTATTRIPPEKWEAHLKLYLAMLDSGNLGKQDEMSEEIRPTRYKKIIIRVHSERGFFSRLISFLKNLWN